MTSLYEIKEEYLDTFQSLELMRDAGDINEETLQDTLSAAAFDFEEKAINVGFYIQNMKSDIAELKEHKRNIDAKIKTLNNRIEWYEDYLRTNMLATDKKAIERPLLTIKIGKASAVLVVKNEADIPDQYKTTETVVNIDKAALKKDLKENPIDGAELVAGKARLAIK